MSSHREAPAISKDPVADNTDTYAFVSPDDPGSVTIISNYLPLEAPFGGPNFFEFGDDVLYEIHIDNNADGHPDITYQFKFHTEVRNPETFLYNTGPIGSIDSHNWNRRQFYSVHRVEGAKRTVLGSHLACPPCNIGPASTPHYATLAQQAVHQIGSETVFAGQRLEGFYVDLGAIFDLGDLRPFEKLHVAGMANAVGVDDSKAFSVHSIALKVPKSELTSNRQAPTNPMSHGSVIGVWAAASRPRAVIRQRGGAPSHQSGSWIQVSRLGNPLFNEVIVPMGQKDRWNALPAAHDKEFLKYVRHPELASLLPILYPGVFPKLAALKSPRADLVAILLTGLPAGVVPGFQNYTGPTYADQLRLNMAIAPAAQPNPIGLIGGDAAGFPNGRRVFDDVVSIELRAIAGATYPLVASGYKPDVAASLLTDGLGPNATRYQSSFPYLGTPNSGYETQPLAA
ncbi:MAG TPA: DUF4331 domain-containing protein, partial [Solirubrobacteraceae bacterium]